MIYFQCSAEVREGWVWQGLPDLWEVSTQSTRSRASKCYPLSHPGMGTSTPAPPTWAPACAPLSMSTSRDGPRKVFLLSRFNLTCLLSSWAHYIIILPVQKRCEELQVQPRGTRGESGGQTGITYDISNKHRLGYSEVRLLLHSLLATFSLVRLSLCRRWLTGWTPCGRRTRSWWPSTPKLLRISCSRADLRKLRKHLTPIDFIAF